MLGSKYNFLVRHLLLWPETQKFGYRDICSLYPNSSNFTSFSSTVFITNALKLSEVDVDLISKVNNSTGVKEVGLKGKGGRRV